MLTYYYTKLKAIFINLFAYIFNKFSQSKTILKLNFAKRILENTLLLYVYINKNSFPLYLFLGAENLRYAPVGNGKNLFVVSMR